MGTVQNKSNVMTGLLWKFSERFLAQGISFAVSIILARLLAPSVYGVVALVMVFINIADVFVVGGFSQALIQKKNADETDFSTIFYCTFATSVLVYIACYLGAPLIASFYDTPELTLVFRVFALKVLISAYSSIQHAYVSRHMQFKRFFFSTLAGTLISAVVGIGLALAGAGVWALVLQYLVNSVVGTVVLCFTVSWRPRLLFSRSSAKNLMSFGWKCLAANLIGVFFNNIRSLLIGKFYTADDLGYYKKAATFPDLIMNNAVSTIMAVLFPAFSEHSDDPERLKNMVRTSVKYTSYILFPLMAGMFVVAKPMILLLLGDAWENCVIYVQILCVYNALHVISQLYLYTLNSMGRSDIVLKQEFFKKPVTLLMVAAALPFGVQAVVLTQPLAAVYTLMVNAHPVKKLLGYRYRELVVDMSQSVILSVVMMVVVLPMTWLPLPNVLCLGLQIVLGVTVYVGGSLLTKNESFLYLKSMFLSKLKKEK